MDNHEKLVDFSTGALSPVVSVLIITLGAALFEAGCPPPNVGGHWYCLTRTDSALRENSTYPGMFLLYDTFLAVDGETITANDEKFAEYSSERHGLFENRVPASGAGAIHRKYFGASGVSIVMTDRGSPRNSIRAYDMAVRGERMAGTFHSSVDNQSGRVVCRRQVWDLSGSVSEVRSRLQNEIDSI